MVATCSGCPTRWTGLKVSHCASCHETFSSVTHFDRHRRDGRCLDPESMGLTIGGRGYWSRGFDYEPPPTLSVPAPFGF